MPAVKTDLSIEQGATWSHGWAVTFNSTPIDDTWSARAQVRKHVSTADALHTFAPIVSAEGVVTLGATAEESSAWDWVSGVYDLEVVNADESVTLRVSQGRVSVSPEVTR